MATVLIFGCGWLGSQLGVALAGAGHQVYGSRRSAQSLLTLPPQIQPLCWDGQSPFGSSIQALSLQLEQLGCHKVSAACIAYALE